MLMSKCLRSIEHAMGNIHPEASAALLRFVGVGPHSTPNSEITFAVNHVWLCTVVTLLWRYVATDIYLLCWWPWLRCVMVPL